MPHGTAWAAADACAGRYPCRVTSGPTDETLPGEEERTDTGVPGLRPDDLVDGRYRLVKRLGAGGMGEVWEVEHVSLRRPMALKLLRSAELATKTQRGRFLREAQVVSRVRHPGVVEITDFGELPNGAPFIAMELLGGRTLHRVCGEDGALPWPRALELARQIGDALAEVHRHGVVHRDLKPDNIFVSPGPPERVKVIDFGIARRNELDDAASKLTATGSVFGTPGYMAPEQIRGEAADARADVYALGCITYELLTGRRIFEGGVFDRLQSHLYEPPPSLPASLPSAVVRMVERCLAKQPDERFRSMDEVVDACMGALGRPAAKRTAIAAAHVPVAPLGASTQSGRPTAPALTPNHTDPMSTLPAPTTEFEPAKPPSTRLAIGLISGIVGLGVLVLLFFAWSRPDPSPTDHKPEPAPAVEPPEPDAQPAPAVAAPPPDEAPAEPVVERAVEKPKPVDDTPPTPQPRKRVPAKPKKQKPRAAPSEPDEKSPKLRPDGTFDVFGD